LDLLAVWRGEFTGHGLWRRHDASGKDQIRLGFVPVRVHSLALPYEGSGPRLGFEGVVAILEAVQALAEYLPDQQAAARLELADGARGLQVAPAVPADRLVAKLGAVVHSQAVVGAREIAEVVDADGLIVRVEDQTACGLFPALRMAGDTTLFQDRFHVPEV